MKARSESRLKTIKHDCIRNGEFPRVYRGGVERSAEPDHMPPRALFSRKQRPNDLVFPSCKGCNSGSSAIDVIISWLARMYPDSPDPKEREEVLQLGRSMAENFPEVASAFYPRDLILTPEQRAGLVGNPTAVNVNDPYVHRVVEFFGAKFGLGMHWLRTNHCVPPEGRVYSQWFTNYQAISGRLPAEIFKVFPDPRPMMQGRWHTSGRFEFAAALDADYTSHLAVFGQSFIVLAFVAPEPPELQFAESGSLECEPGCLKVGYPYGLPRLSRAELDKRFGVA